MARYKDLSLTFRKHPITGDITRLFDEDSIKESLINLVMTRNYEIPFHPEIGCAVMESLFENPSKMTANTIRKSIEDVIVNFEPRVDLLDVDVQVEPDFTRYMATITYRIKNQADPVSITMFLEKKR
jgi:phage baseplate assembly protein W